MTATVKAPAVARILKYQLLRRASEIQLPGRLVKVLHVGSQQLDFAGVEFGKEPPTFRVNSVPHVPVLWVLVEDGPAAPTKMTVVTRTTGEVLPDAHWPQHVGTVVGDAVVLHLFVDRHEATPFLPGPA